LHIKIKHNGGNKTDREKFAKSLVYSQASGMNLPKDFLLSSLEKLNLPPGSIEQAAKQVGVTIATDQLDEMESELRRRNIVMEREKKKAELLKTKKVLPDNYMFD
jgi:hypothetical protein